MGVPPPGKAVLSMSGLSHCVIRVDTEEKLSVLTVQDVGQVMPGGTVSLFAAVIRIVRIYNLNSSFTLLLNPESVSTNMSTVWQ